MSDVILDTDNNILKLLEFDPASDKVLLCIKGKNPINYVVTPVECLDENLKNCVPEHVDILLDARSYLYKKDMTGVDEPTA